MRWIILALLFSASAKANTTRDVTLSWTEPTTYNNGQMIPSGYIKGYNVYYGTRSGWIGYLYVQHILEAKNTAIVHVSVPGGSHTVYMTVTALAQIDGDTEIQESDFGLEVTRMIVAPGTPMRVIVE